MAGYVKLSEDNWLEFHIGAPRSAKKWHQSLGNTRVVTVQVDGDELNAVLFGLAVFRKNHNELQQSLHEVITSLMHHKNHSL